MTIDFFPLFDLAIHRIIVYESYVLELRPLCSLSFLYKSKFV